MDPYYGFVKNEYKYQLRAFNSQIDYKLFFIKNDVLSPYLNIGFNAQMLISGIKTTERFDGSSSKSQMENLENFKDSNFALIIGLGVNFKYTSIHVWFIVMVPASLLWQVVCMLVNI